MEDNVVNFRRERLKHKLRHVFESIKRYTSGSLSGKKYAYPNKDGKNNKRSYNKIRRKHL